MEHDFLWTEQPMHWNFQSLEMCIRDRGYPLQDPRFRFTNAVVVLALRLYHRPDWVALECRSPKTWVDVNATKWRSVEDGLPPPGMPVMVMAKPKS